MKKFARRLLLLSLFLVYSPLTVVQASENESAPNGFSVTPLSIETGEPQSSYYDLTVVPNEEKKIKLKLFNSSAKDIEVKVEVNNGITNNNGITSYLKEKKRDSSLKVGLTDFTKVENEKIKVPKQGYAEAVLHLTIPDKAFEGEILGGVRFTSNDVKNDDSSKETAVTNNMAYTVGILLREDAKKFSPEIKLNEIKIEQRNSRNYISSNLQNAAPTLVKELEVKAEVTNKGEKEVLYTASNSDMRMAPNSNFFYGISLQNQPFKAGNYTMKITGTADGEAFSFEKDFKIDKEEAKKLNESAVFVTDKPQDNTWLYVALGGVVVLLLLTGGYIVYIKKNGGKAVDED
ncbi:TPA: DUF3324 domain-containing protein [Enterococcus faecalis]